MDILKYNLEGKKLKKGAAPVKAEEPNTDWTMIAIASAAGVGIIVFLNLIKPQSETAEQINGVPSLPI